MKCKLSFQFRFDSSNYMSCNAKMIYDRNSKLAHMIRKGKMYNTILSSSTLCWNIIDSIDSF